MLEPIKEVGALINLMAQAVVDEPDAVKVEAVLGTESVVYNIRVAQDDLGQAIGKLGRIANAMRVLAKACAMKHGMQKVYLEILGDQSFRYD